MNGFNCNTGDEVIECPLCMEPLEVDDLNFYPCTCGYQICRFCWHRIRTDENKLCPACRKEYPENPADFTPLTQEEMIAFKSQKKQRDLQRKQKITENRKHLANVRVVQKNLVFVVGLPPRLADADVLKKHEYFGKFGKIHKVVINPSTTYAGVQGPSASAYVTYVHNSDALRAIQSVNNIMIDGRLIKTSLGTTKYCSHFMKNQQCPKNDCMYLHELGDPEASFTKEEMHQGKHQEYEKRLHDCLIASSVQTLGGTHTNEKYNDLSKGNRTSSAKNSPMVESSVSTVKVTHPRETWPTLSLSSVESLETQQKNKKKEKSERIKNEKSKSKTKTNTTTSNLSTHKDTQNHVASKEVASKAGLLVIRSDKKDKSNNDRLNSKNNNEVDKKFQKCKEKVIVLNEEVTKPMKSGVNENIVKLKANKVAHHTAESDFEKQRSISSGSNISTTCDCISILSESWSGKSTPAVYIEEITINADESDATSSDNLLEKSDVDKANCVKKETNNNEQCTSILNDSMIKMTVQDSDSLFTSDHNEQMLSKKGKNIGSSHLPDLLNGIDENEYSTSTDEWNEAFKNVIGSCSSEIGDQYQTRKQEDVLWLQEIQRKQNVIGAVELQSSLLQPQLLHQQQTNLSEKELVGTNMSRFFDFHKNQQLLNQQKCTGHQHQDRPLMQNDQNCVQNQFSQMSNDDDLGFDPFIETQKALAELIENETVQQSSGYSVNHMHSNAVPTKLLHHPQHQQLLDSMHRTRMPPPGFNHMNAFGLGLPRNHNASKLLPYMNIPAAVSGANNQHSQQLPISSSWNSQIPLMNVQTASDAVGQFHQNRKSEVYCGNDWTAMDPAILSLRQFPTYQSQAHVPHNQQQQAMFIQQMLHHQTGQNFNCPMQHSGVTLPGSLLNSQHASQTQVNANVQGMLEFLKTRQYV